MDITKLNHFDKKVVYYNRLYRFFLLLAVSLVLVLVAIGVKRVYIISGQIDTNVQNTQAILENDTQGYIKCILLLKYDNPELSPNSTRQEVGSALDRCAKT